MKEVLWAVLVPGHRVSPVWRLQYSRVLWLARQARTPGAGQVLVQAILEETDHPPDTGPVGRALKSVRQLRWEAVPGWWVWRVPGRREELHLTLGDWGEVCHRVRESQRYTVLAALERTRPATFGGLGAEVCKLACAWGMTVASSEPSAHCYKRCKPGRRGPGHGSGSIKFPIWPPAPTAGAPRRQRSVSFGTARGGKHSGPLGSQWCGPRQRSCRHWPSRQRGRCAYAQRACCRQHWSD